MGFLLIKLTLNLGFMSYNLGIMLPGHIQAIDLMIILGKHVIATLKQGALYITPWKLCNLLT